MISFIIPIYNKEQILFKTLSSVLKNIQLAGIDDFEIIAVDDGSRDKSLAEAVRFKKLNNYKRKIHIYSYTKNIGKGFALKYGFLKSKGDPVIFVDGDMDIDTNQILKTLNIFAENRTDILVGSKYLPQSRTYYPFNRYVYSRILKFLTRVMFNLSVSDTQVGLKIFRRGVLDKILPLIIVKRFATDLEILAVAHMYGYRITEAPVIIRHSSANSSSINIWAVKNFLQDMLAIFYRKNLMHYYYKKQHLPFLTPVIQTA